MDPNACMRLLNDALEDGQFGEVGEHADNLCAWLSRGGFAPSTPLVTEWPEGLGENALDALEDLSSQLLALKE